MLRVIAGAVFLLCLTWSSLTLANVAERLGFKLKGVVQGKDIPALTFTPGEDVKELTVTLFRADGSKSNHRLGAIGSGEMQKLEVTQPKGKFHYKAKIDVVWGDGKKSELRTQFDLTRADDFSMRIAPDEVDLDGRSLKFSLSQPAGKAELRVFDSADKEIGFEKKDFSGAEANTKLDISWKPAKAEVAYIKLRAWNEKGFWTEMRLEPVSLRIPHQDVEFDSGKATVRKDQEPKLEDTLTKLQRAVSLHGQTIAVRLYIAGYCDTMGPAAQNRALSAQRARSIGQWFRSKGLKIPIFYQGFGEDVLAVQTPDETPEAGNRRALYVLSTHTPAKNSDLPKDDWKSL